MIIQVVDRAPAIELSDFPFNITGSSFLFSKKRHSFIPRGKKKDRRTSMARSQVSYVAKLAKLTQKNPITSPVQKVSGLG